MGRYAGRDDGAVRTNKLLILHNAHALGHEHADEPPTWEKGERNDEDEEMNGRECRSGWTDAAMWVSSSLVALVSLGNIKGRAGHVTFLRDGKLYVHGGYDTGHGVLADLIEIDITSGTSSALEDQLLRTIACVIHLSAFAGGEQASTSPDHCRTSPSCRTSSDDGTALTSSTTSSTFTAAGTTPARSTAWFHLIWVRLS